MLPTLNTRCYHYITAASTVIYFVSICIQNTQLRFKKWIKKWKILVNGI